MGLMDYDLMDHEFDDQYIDIEARPILESFERYSPDEGKNVRFADPLSERLSGPQRCRRGAFRERGVKISFG
jgi:hypothetical protein